MSIVSIPCTQLLLKRNYRNLPLKKLSNQANTPLEINYKTSPPRNNLATNYYSSGNKLLPLQEYWSLTYYPPGRNLVMTLTEHV